MWLTVITVSIVGDVGTTIFGIHTPGIVESNPIWIGYFQDANYLGLLIGKSLIVIAAFGIDYVISENMGSWAFPIIPVFFIYSGTYATLNNLYTLHYAGANSVAIILVLSSISLAIVEFLHSRFGYPLF